MQHHIMWNNEIYAAHKTTRCLRQIHRLPRLSQTRGAIPWMVMTEGQFNYFHRDGHREDDAGIALPLSFASDDCNTCITTFNTKSDGIPYQDLALPNIEETSIDSDWDNLDKAELEYYSIDSTTVDNSLEFVAFHCFIYDIINQWRATTSLHKEMKVKWSKWIYQGLRRDKGFHQIKTILGITRLSEYLDIVKKCPMVDQQIKWAWHGYTLWYWFVPNQTMRNNILYETPAKLTTWKSELQLFSHKFDLSLTDVNNKVRDQMFRLDVLDERTRKYAKTLESTLHIQGQRIVQDHRETLCKITEKLENEHKRAVYDIIEKIMV